MILRTALVLSWTLLVASCSSPKGLDETPMSLSPDEAALVEEQVARAREAEEWTAAWNQAVDAGTDRSGLEAIALDALEADDGAAEDMLDALRRKWGGLTPAGRERVTALSRRAMGKKDYERAASIEVFAAEDAPAYAAAWRIYRETPPGDAEAVLEVIRSARAREEGAAD
ncbi:MAG: hypothetical protein ACYTG6_12160 [Planctomycetota bacterium]|jgi:hypothetical protein